MSRKKVSIDEMVYDINNNGNMFTDDVIYNNRKRVVPMTDPDKFKPVLYNNLYVPSYVHGFSLAIEYMKEWFLKYLPDINFRYIHINGKHMFDDYKRFNNQNIKREKPCLIITPNVDYEYNRDNRDLYQAPADIFLRRSDYQRSFFKDTDNKLYLGMQMQNLRMQFNFRVKVSTRAEQLDLKEKMNLRFRIGATQGEYRSADFVVPMELLVNIAHDAGFKVKEFEQCTSNSVYSEGLEYFNITSGKYMPINVSKDNFYSLVQKGLYVRCLPSIEEPMKFLEYLNTHTLLPFSYKLRAISNHPEYYIRLNDLYCHISTMDHLSLDDGEREGMLDNNFNIDFQAELDIPVPHFFVYYTKEYLTYDFEVYDKANYGFYTVTQFIIPEKNNQGWGPYVNTEYLADPHETEIDMSPIFKGTTLGKVIESTLSKFISPDSFMDIEIFIDNAGEITRVFSEFDYGNMKLKIQDFDKEQMLYIIVYVDKLYMNEELLTIEKLDGRI